MNSPDSPTPLILSPERLTALQGLARRLGHRFQELSLLDLALRHSSYAHEHPEHGPSNEQLEFLGDAVLNLAVSQLLCLAFPQSPEGELSRRRATLVNARQLAALARDLDLGPHLLLGRGEERQGGRLKASLLADALEAVLAAVFLDAGFKSAQKLGRRWFAPLLPLTADLARHDAKTALQELTQSRYKSSPTYHLLDESCPGHELRFRVELRLNGRSLAQGEGPTKKAAEQAAARQALAILGEEQNGESEKD